MTRRTHEGTRPRRHDGFTIVELLVVIAVIIVLLSLLTVAIASAARSSQSAQTLTLMNSIKQALVQFKSDIGYLPPVLDADRKLVEYWDSNGQPAFDTAEYQDYRSITTLPDYLIGYGNEQRDGYGQPGDQTLPAPGIRHPGRDGVWLATVNGQGPMYGSLDARNTGSGERFGKVYGPYLELKDQRLLASTDGTADQNGDLQAFMPGEAGYDADDPKVIVDYWGQPITYYRRPTTLGALGTPYRAFSPGDYTPTLADVFVLRPFELDPGAAIDGLPDQNPDIAGGDTTTTSQLKTAEFALFSPGPDRRFTPEVRYDASDSVPEFSNEFNRDNIVEVGP